jgi:RNA polymerase-binding transcription factor DksA
LASQSSGIGSLRLISRYNAKYFRRCVLNSHKKHSALSDEEIRQTKQNLIQVCHRLRVQIPSELIEVSKEKLVPEGDDGQGLDTLSSLRLVGSEHVVDMLRRIEHTLARIDDGRYGLCICCGGEIDKEILLKQITENTCANCKSEGD